MRRLALAGLVLLLPGSAVAEPSRTLIGAAARSARQSAALALVDPGWADRRAHLRALVTATADGTDRGERDWPAVLRAEGPIYRLPVTGRIVREAADPASGRHRPGLVIRPRPGAGIVAPATGRVAYAGPFRGYGDVLILDHGHGWTTVLTGLAAVRPAQGTTVYGGETLGEARGRVRVQLLHHGRAADVARMAALLGGG